LPIDDAISEMIRAGLDPQDLQQLERLNKPEVLKALPAEKRHLRHNQRDDVVLYLRTWADLMEQKLLDRIKLRLPKDVEAMA
jgi:hypothetical protein